jgi:hypothetical protein
MAFTLSQGLVNYLSSHGSLREGFDDCIMNIYSGAVPVTAEEAPGGTLLCPITIASGAVAVTDQSTARSYSCILASDHTLNHTAKLDVTIDGATVTHTLTVVAADSSDELVAEHFARMVNDIQGLHAIRLGAALGVRTVLIAARIRGLALTLADHGSSDIALTIVAVQTAARVAALCFGPPTIGVISIAGGVWSGVNLATGVASFFRFVRPDDSGAYSLTDKRLQGTISTSGADCNLSNTTLTVSATTTIDSGNFEVPESE